MTDDGYRNLVLADGPLVYLPLDESSGTTFADLSGNGNDATSSSSLSSYADHGPTGRSIYVDGSINVDLASPVSLTGDFTLEAWVRVTSYSGIRPIWGHAQSGGTSLKLNAGRPEQELPRGVGYVSTGYEVRDRSWQHLAHVREGSTLRMYQNGSLTRTVTVGTDTVAVSRLGYDRSTPNRIGGGWLAHCAVFDKALPAAVLRRRAIAVSPPRRVDPFVRALLRADPFEVWPMNDRRVSIADASISAQCSGIVRGLPLFLQDPSTNPPRFGPSLPYEMTGGANRFAVALAGQLGEGVAPTGFTFLSWVFHEDGGTQRTIWQQRGDGNGRSFTYLLSDSSLAGQPGFGIDGNSILRRATSSRNRRGRWHLHAGVWRGNGGQITADEFSVWIDGVADPISTSTAGGSTPSEPATPNSRPLIGRHEAWNSWTSATVAGVALFHRALKSAELRQIARARARGRAPDRPPRRRRLR